MGPTSVFELLKGELEDIVDYADNCRRKTGRPPRLAVNASSWWYCNMTTVAAQAVRDRAGGHANPIESNILFYTLRILRLGIQLHFVFDGPKHMSSRSKLHPGHDAPSRLFQETLTNVGIPWHQAPANAEAECAKMELEGIVDAVWSEDGDALAFGSKALIMSHFEAVSATERARDIRKSYIKFKVLRLEELARKYPGMEREGFILYAILNSRSHDIGEISNLQPKDILRAAGNGLGRSLCVASGSVENLRQWAATDFTTYLKDNDHEIEIPSEFPKRELVQNYLNPIVSSPRNILGLRAPQDPFLDEKKLFLFLVKNFQWTIRQWVDLIIPVRIIRLLLVTKEGEESQHDYLELECDVKKNSKIVKVAFSLCKATSLDVTSLYEVKGRFETLLWVIGKAIFNKQRSIVSYFTPPRSDKKGKSVSSASTFEKPSRQLRNGAGREPLTPASASVQSSSAAGPSRIDRSRRHNTPPSPTPTSKKRTLPWRLSTGVSKNIRSAPKTDRGTTSQTKDKGKGKAKEISPPPRTNKRRPQSPADSSGFYEKLRDKRPKLNTDNPPSTPPARVTAPVDAIPDLMLVDSHEREGRAAANAIVIDSDSDSDETVYGSFPSLTDLPILPEVGCSRAIQNNDQDDLSSDDDYGSFPSSPDLRALM